MNHSPVKKDCEDKSDCMNSAFSLRKKTANESLKACGNSM